MTVKKKHTLLDHFADLPDPRIERTKRHELSDILAIAICGVISGAEHWTEIEEFGEAKESWFRSFLVLPNGIPSHDTFQRVFERLDPAAFGDRFLAWIRTLYKNTGGRVVAIDGKTLRGSANPEEGKAALHMVSAWVQGNRLLLGQVKTEEKSNEITAIPELLKILDLAGCIVTLDAMGCQKAIARDITARGADYVLGLKGNQSKLQEEVEHFFLCAQRDRFAHLPVDYEKTVEKDHGRIETREYWIVSDSSFDPTGEWGGLKAVGMVRSERKIKGVSSFETRYYIASRPLSAREFAQAVRGHWSIENDLHWTLDVAFREDDCLLRKGNGPENFALLRRIALNLLKQDTLCNRGIKTKRRRCGWDEGYLVAVVFGG